MLIHFKLVNVVSFFKNLSTQFLHENICLYIHCFYIHSLYSLFEKLFCLNLIQLILLLVVLIHSASVGPPRTSHKGPLKALTFGTYRRYSVKFQGINRKIDNLKMNLYFGSNSHCITYLFLLFIEEGSIPKSFMEHPQLFIVANRGKFLGSNLGTSVECRPKNSSNMCSVLAHSPTPTSKQKKLIFSKNYTLKIFYVLE